MLKSKNVCARKRVLTLLLLFLSSSSGSNTTVVEVTVVVVVLLCIGVVAGILVARKRNLLGAKSSSNGRISFENPSYIREQNGDTVQVSKTCSVLRCLRHLFKAKKTLVVVTHTQAVISLGHLRVFVICNSDTLPLPILRLLRRPTAASTAA